MKPELQRVKIAEACGYKLESKKRGTDTAYRWLTPTGAIVSLCGNQWGAGWGPTAEDLALPDFCHSLDAMHEAEKVLTEVRQVQFSNQLRDVIRLQSPVSVCTLFDQIHASAAQRAEAFLRTLNLWTDQ